MEATIIPYKTINIKQIAILLISAMIIFSAAYSLLNTRYFTTTTIPAVEVMQWSSDTSWVEKW
ncbi:MAG: hypothetical protein J5644_03725 [Bacteroidales bacterium]|nr:hypothetical protein [Bacteroidales bacterium]